MPASPAVRPPTGFGGLRRSGTVTELLFLYECATQEPTQLRPIAESLGLTVQAASHAFRQLSRRGLAEVRGGRYLPTVEGVQWLHAALGGIGEDVQGRIARLHVIRSCRAIAGRSIRAGEKVSLSLEDGLLTALPGGSGPSVGRARSGARLGELLDVVDLEGITPLERGEIQVLSVRAGELGAPTLPRRISRFLALTSEGLLGAQGLEAFHLLRRSTERPIVRFAVGAAALEASRVGVSSTIVVLDEELPRLLAQFSGPGAPPISVASVGGARSHRRHGRRVRAAR